MSRRGAEQQSAWYLPEDGISLAVNSSGIRRQRISAEYRDISVYMKKNVWRSYHICELLSRL